MVDGKRGEETKRGSIKMKIDVLGELELAMNSQQPILGKFGDNGSEKWALKGKFYSTKGRRSSPYWGDLDGKEGGVLTLYKGQKFRLGGEINN